MFVLVMGVPNLSACGRKTEKYDEVVLSCNNICMTYNEKPHLF